MRRVTIDTTEAQGFEPIEPGPYQMKVETITDPEKSKPSQKNPQGVLGLTVTFRFVDPNFARHNGDIDRWYAVAGKGAGFIREFWKAATGEDIPLDHQFDVDLDTALGRVVICQVGNESFEGRLRNRVERVVAVS